MDKQISVGDLVQIVKWPCCDAYLGAVYKVSAFHKQPLGQCRQCRASIPSVLFCVEEGNGYAAPPEWLKRIPPLDELETVRTEDEVTA